MLPFVVLLTFCQAALSQGYGNYSYFRASGYKNTGAIAAQISHLTKTWVAGENPLPPASYVTGVNLDDFPKTRLPQAILIQSEELILPDTFDARQKWPECQSLNVIRNQGCCGSCWAVSAVSTMSDRWCIRSKGREHFTFGAADLMSCCHSCGDGCNGGTLGPAWKYWVEKGISSGGPFNSNEGCHPYPIDQCRRPGEEEEAPRCSKRCRSGYNVTDVFEDRRYGRLAYSLPNEEQKIMEDILVNGPLQASFRVYTDFKAYKSGIYRHVWGPLESGHAIEIIGWGIENGNKYWLCKNSWGNDWGEHGFFRIVRGENHLGIEEDVHGGLPSYKKHVELQGIY
uniref:Putative cathepsin b-like thiol protease n=1 Tax=Psorophora albipes TaxID=869069 RepID=T1DIB0_9DIPT